MTARGRHAPRVDAAPDDLNRLAVHPREYRGGRQVLGGGGGCFVTPGVLAMFA
jgi:hypothetical protein